MKKHRIAIITGPSGVGKTTLTIALLKKMKKWKPSVTYTTRGKRNDTKEDKIIHYVTKNQFRKLISQNALVEWAKVYGDYYGTAKQSIQNILKKNNILMNIDIKGIKIIKRKFPDTVTIFIKPENFQDLQERLSARNMAPAKKRRRLKEAKDWIKKAKQYDYQVINYNHRPSLAINEIAGILRKIG